jgi:hypothetical protein
MERDKLHVVTVSTPRQLQCLISTWSRLVRHNVGAKSLTRQMNGIRDYDYHSNAGKQKFLYSMMLFVTNLMSFGRVDCWTESICKLPMSLNFARIVVT